MTSQLDLSSAVSDRRADHAGDDGQGPHLDGYTLPAHDELAALRAELDGLRQRLATLPVIEQSKGLLMRHYGVDADTAFAILRRWSCDTNTKLREISEHLVAAASQPMPHKSNQTALHHAIQRLSEHAPDHSPNWEGARSPRSRAYSRLASGRSGTSPAEVVS